jgi:serine/threonine-protein kinase
MNMSQTANNQFMSDRWIGTQLGDVLLERCMNAGELATVYRGRRGAVPVALKLYRADVPVPASDERVRRERDAQRSVDHPNVARLLDFGMAPDGAPYLVSEWVSGMSLAERLAIGPLPWPALHPILVSLARGLAAIHAAGVLHRDVKPENIVLPASAEPAAKLLDFGHSMIADEARLTERGFTLGTASYMAPEQALGRPLDARADLYSLGVVLYRALTGVLPFVDRSPAVVMEKHLHEIVVPPRQRAPEAEISEAAEDLTLWLTAKDPNERVPNAHVLLHALRGLGSQLEGTR